MIGVNGKGSSAITESTGNISYVLIKGSAKMKKVKVSFEGDRPGQLCDCLLLLLAIHQHCKTDPKKVNFS